MKTLLTILIIFLVPGCQNKPDNRSTATPRTEAALIELNRSMISHDREAISAFLAFQP